MCKCENYKESIFVDNKMIIAFKCEDCGREWFEVYDIQYKGEYEGNYEEEGWGM
jgi:hypothetical protein